MEIVNDGIVDIFEEILQQDPDYIGMAEKQLAYQTNVREYALAASTVYIQKVEVTDLGGPPYPTLRPIGFKDIGKFVVPVPTLPQLAASGQGEPLGFYTRQPDPSSGTLMIGFDPIPFRTASTNNVNVWYNVYPTLITAIDTTVPDLPLDLHRLIPLRMCVLAAGADASPRTGFYTNLYNDALEKAILRAAKSRSGARDEFQIIE